MHSSLVAILIPCVVTMGKIDFVYVAIWPVSFEGSSSVTLSVTQGCCLLRFLVAFWFQNMGIRCVYLVFLSFKRFFLSTMSAP